MTQTSPSKLHSAEVPKRPKGILKNSFSGSLPTETQPNPLTTAPTIATPSPTDKDLTLQNTLQNAGHRRSSSATTRTTPSRRQSSNSSSTTHPTTADLDDNNPRLKWDEVNLYLTEQEKSSTMKINEPKTPYAKHYSPSEDEDEMRTLDAEDLVVDELDKVSNTGRRKREEEIPGLELGEPEENFGDGIGGGEGGRIVRSGSVKGEKQVQVEPGAEEGHEEVGWSREEREKHRLFEERRKRHYEMKEVKGLLAHPEQNDDMDEDEDEEEIARPPRPLPVQSRAIPNGTS